MQNIRRILVCPYFLNCIQFIWESVFQTTPIWKIFLIIGRTNFRSLGSITCENTYKIQTFWKTKHFEMSLSCRSKTLIFSTTKMPCNLVKFKSKWKKLKYQSFIFTTNYDLFEIVHLEFFFKFLKTYKIYINGFISKMCLYFFFFNFHKFCFTVKKTNMISNAIRLSHSEMSF